MELLIALVLMGLVVLGINSITLFSRYQLISSERRVKLQNDISFCLDHITKRGLNTIGNESIFGNNSAVLIVPNVSLALYIDSPSSSIGIRDANDYWVKYTFNSSTHQLSYCDNCRASSACPTCSVGTEVLSNKITAFSCTKNFTQGNFVEVKITSRWDPAASVSVDNPEVTMHATIYLPSLSTN